MGENSKKKGMFLREESTEGKGTFKYTNGCKYEGQWKDNIRDEIRTHTLSDGSKNIAPYKYGCRQGKGTQIFPDGQKYLGLWDDDGRQGKGIYI